jgi:hypothetical protein
MIPYNKIDSVLEFFGKKLPYKKEEGLSDNLLVEESFLDKLNLHLSGDIVFFNKGETILVQDFEKFMDEEPGYVDREDLIALNIALEEYIYGI